MSLATSFFQSWSRGVGANLLAANEGMGLMHTGSGIFSSACHSHGRFHRPLDFLPVKVSRALLAFSPVSAASVEVPTTHVEACC